MMQKSRKLSFLLKQNETTSLVKQLSNVKKIPKVHFDRTRSYELTNAERCTGSDHTEQRRNKKKPSNWLKATRNPIESQK